jgi:hypothetical protein
MASLEWKHVYFINYTTSTSIEDELEKEYESAEIFTDLYFTSSQTV